MNAEKDYVKITQVTTFIYLLFLKSVKFNLVLNKKSFLLIQQLLISHTQTL